MYSEFLNYKVEWYLVKGSEENIKSRIFYNIEEAAKFACARRNNNNVVRLLSVSYVPSADWEELAE